MNILCEVCFNPMIIEQNGPQVDHICHHCNRNETKFLSSLKKRNFSFVKNKKQKQEEKIAS